MKKILITGQNSYIGNSFFNWIANLNPEIKVQKISLRESNANEINFRDFDSILHTVGIAHVDSNPDPSMEKEYYRVNRDLAIETAKKAKAAGVRQFIFLSSIIVYGDSGKIGERKVITKETIPQPSNFYGNSKLLAEEGLKELEDQHFKVAIIRIPMIYGKGSKGNYQKLAKAAKLLPIFPDIKNERSMLHIDNLCEFLRLISINEARGTFFPQNAEYVSTSKMVKAISNVNGKKIFLISAFNPLIKLIANKVNIINKVFGNLVYDQSLSHINFNYRIRTFKETVIATER